MEETYLLNVEGVRKKILHGGRGELPKFQDGSKITFHFQTLKDNFERTVIDDSREAGMPMEIIVGKMFKIEIWETLLCSMRTGEVAEFWCDAIHTGMYALVSKGMRRIAEGRDPLEGQKHRCGMGNMFDYHSTGYDDLDELQRTPQPLIFIMELFRVEEPSAYKRDTWAMSKEEKLAAVPVLHSEGNRLVLQKEFQRAAEKYQEAVICLRNLQAKEKPWEEGWLKLESLVTPLVLNYCQCQLELGEYYEVLEHTTELLQKHNDNAKAYFKRAKAHAAVWNEREAREDFLRVAHLDPAMAAAVKKELKLLGERMRKKHVEDRKRYQGLFQQPRGGRAGGDGRRQEEVGCHGREQGVGMGEAGVGEGEQGMAGDGCGKEEWGRGTAPGEAEVVGNGVGQGGEVKLGVCRAELESCGAERGVEGGEEEEEEEGKVMVEEEKEMVEKEEEVVEEAEEKEKTMEEEQKGKKEAVEEEEEREETVEREEDMVEEKEKRKETEEGEEEMGKVEEEEERKEEAVEGKEEVGKVEEEDGVEEVEAVVEKQEGKKETMEETVEKEEEKEKVEEENSAAKMEKLAEGQCEEAEKGELMLGLEAGGAKGAGAKSMAGEESGRAAEQAPAYLDQGTFQGELGKGSCGGQQADNFPTTPITNGAVLQAGPLGAREELDGGTEVPLPHTS
uniref:AIP/AIPL N-terminal FKBP-type PPIase domain-containing protein n=1 Tax=Phasianus colchicus TaxID=9054 RepID=A0A669PRL6_PHACC